MSIQNIVNVQISAETTAIPQAGFGTAMILETHNIFTTNRVKEYSSADALLVGDTHFASDSAVYLAASKYFAQIPTPTKIFVGRRLPESTATATASTPLIADNSTIVTVNGNATSATVYATSHNATMTAIAVKVALLDHVVSCTASGNVLTIVGDVNLTVSVATTLGVSQPTWTVALLPEAVADALAACLRENKSWYGLLLTTRDEDDVEAAASWAGTNKRLFATASSDSAILAAGNTDNIAHTLIGKDHAICIYHENHKDSDGDEDWGGDDAYYADAALLGRILPMDPGSYTAKFKFLNDIPASDLNDDEISNAKAKNCNVYTSVATISMFQDGQVAKPEWIDTIIGIDWLQARMTERIFGRLVNMPKIPFTDAGIGIIEADIKAQLQEAVNKGFLTADPAPIVVVPKAKDISSNDKNLRQLNGITFTGFLAGAIHYTEIRGVVKSEG